MLSFEKILQVFEDILRRDPLYEVVPTSHGYTLLGWDEHRHQWYSAELLETPEDMLDRATPYSAEIWHYPSELCTGGGFLRRIRLENRHRVLQHLAWPHESYCGKGGTGFPDDHRSLLAVRQYLQLHRAG